MEWRRVGTQGDEWKHGQIYVDRRAGSPVTIIFEGIRGKGYAGDIALDDITFTYADFCPAERTFLQILQIFLCPIITITINIALSHLCDENQWK